MPRAEANKSYNNFTAGLITEVNPLTFPENASLDEVNMVLSLSGPRQRRLGMDYENAYALTTLDLSASAIGTMAITTYEWRNVNDDPNSNMAVVQIGSDFYFYDLDSENVSANAFNGGASVSITMDTTQEAGYAAVMGRLVIATGEQKTTFLEYDTALDTIIKTERSVSIRDLIGVEDSIGTKTRPTSLTETHKYNLHNQGWTTTNITTFKNETGVYPSNADLMPLGKRIDEDGAEFFDSAQLVSQYFGSTPAPRGGTIIDAFNRGASRNAGGSVVSWRAPRRPDGKLESNDDPISWASTDFTGSGTLPKDQTFTGCSTVASFGGRVFYAGAGSDITDGDARSPNLGGYIFFSQVLENMEKATVCHSQADPTSEHVPDLIDTDGGTITISEASNIQKLITVAGSLVVFAATGIWEIKGGDGGFSATDFDIRKISDVGAVGGGAVVSVDGAVFYWSDTGIFVISPEEVSGYLTSKSLTDTTIKTLYNAIPSVVKKNVIGTYDKAAKQVRWLYSIDTAYDGVVDRFKFDKELIFDFNLNAFYKHEIQQSGGLPYATGYLDILDIITLDDEVDVIADGSVVVLSTGEIVTISTKVRSRGDRATKYTTLVPGTVYDLTFSAYKRNDFLDWKTFDGVGVDAEAFLLTGYETFQDTQRNKKVTYLTTQFDRTETTFDDDGELINQSSCLVQAQWEWTNSTTAGRWGPQFQAYRLHRNYLREDGVAEFDYSFTVISTRSKLRGKGRALSLKFETEPGKDLRLLGWSLNVTGEQKV